MLSGFTTASRLGSAAIPLKTPASGPRACCRNPAADHDGASIFDEALVEEVPADQDAQGHDGGHLHAGEPAVRPRRLTSP